jgi:YcxB-like protein
MHLRVTLSKADVARANLLLLAKSPSSLKGIGIFTAALGALLYFTRTPDTATNWAVLAVAALIGGVAAFVVSCSISLLWILKNSTDEAGVTGEHLFEITDDGFRDKTAQNDTLQAWKGMWKPLRSRHLILVRINAYLFHVLPRRGFTDATEYEAWWNELHRRCGAA